MLLATRTTVSWQTDAIRDYVFPIFTLKEGERGYRFDQFLGTAFLIGSSGFALTAAHVVRGKSGFMTGVFVKEERYAPFPVESQELHPNEDVALIIEVCIIHDITRA